MAPQTLVWIHPYQDHVLVVPRSEEKHISIPIRDLFTFVDIHGVHSNLERFAPSESQPTAARSITLEKGVDARYLEWVTVTDTASAMQFDVPFNDLRDFVAFYIRLKLIERLHVMSREQVFSVTKAFPD